MDLQRIKQLLEYDKVKGTLHVRKSKRLLTPDDQGFVTIYDNLTKKRTKMKADRLCYEMGTDAKLSDSLRLLHRNLKTEDNRLVNLLPVTRAVYRQIQEAIRNLDGYLKLNPHPEDQYSYVISYQSGGVDKREVKYDIGAAKTRYLRLQLKFAKLLNKYCIFN